MINVVRMAIGSLIIFLGIFFLFAGGILFSIGGSAYYLISGVFITASGFFTIKNKYIGPILFILVWYGTLFWAIGEVGFSPFLLMPRIFVMTVLAVLVVVLMLLNKDKKDYRLTVVYSTIGSVALTFVCIFIILNQDYGKNNKDPHFAWQHVPSLGNSQESDWSVYGGTLSGRRYSALTDITPANVSRLELAWVQRSGDLPVGDEVKKHIREIHSEATPIHIGHRLYTCAPHGRVQAIDDTSGKTLWTYTEKPERAFDPYLVCRGVTYYEPPAGRPCPHRVFAPVYDAYIVAVDADTGHLCSEFGNHGKIDLHNNMGDSNSEGAVHQISSSAPTVINNRLIVGERIDDGVDRIIGSGVVRAFDPDTGSLVWAWDVGRGQDAIKSLPPNEIFTPGTPNVWGWISGDADNRIVYLGTGNASPDYFNGMHRSFDNTFSASIVALNTETGKLIWSRQLVHHDMWDMDLPTGPSLFDYKAPDGHIVPAMIQNTKSGQIYFLNRLNGDPISPITELPVSTDGAAPGQRVSPTQPFSTGMPSLTPKAPDEISTWGVTPIDHLLCRIDLKRAQNTGIYKPVGMRPIIGHPAFDGVSDWGGVAIDPQHNIMTINTMEVPFKLWLAKRDSPEGKDWIKKARPGEDARNTLVATQYNTPYIGLTKAWIGLFGAPCLAPPWGKLTAIDLVNRKILWSKPLGTARDTGLFGSHIGLPITIGVPNIGGSMMTAGGLIFIAATTDQYLRAFDERSGQELWSARLPAGAQATPMTYRGQDGRQYVVITAGGHGALGTRFGDYTLAFALPKKQSDH